jgi:murein DD-endopeptidase MepM/ murein hydrolase activator NlpD
VSAVSRRSHLRHGALLCLALSACIGLVVPAGADETISDIRKKREEAREAQTAALEQIDLLEEEDVRIAEILAEIQAIIDAQWFDVQTARQALLDAETEVQAREDMVEQSELNIVATLDEMRVRAIEAYVGTSNELDTWLASGDPNRTAVRQALLDFTAGSERDILDDLRRLRAEREEHVIAGADARKEADALRQDIETELATFEEHQAVQVEIQNELNARIDTWYGELEQREADDADFTAIIREKQQEALGFDPGAPGAPSVEGFVKPTNGRVGSAFGPRLHPIFGTVRQHAGVDISGSTGDAIWTSKEGEVIFAGWKGGYGNTVIVAHVDGIATLYAHMSEIFVSSGDNVDQGDVLGAVGSTGWSTGPHLHFETRVNGVPRDPMIFLP